MRPTAMPVFWYSLAMIGAALLGAFGPDPFAPLQNAIAAHGGVVGFLSYYGFIG